MKRFIGLLLVLLLVAGVAHAEIEDISKLTDDELIQLKEQISAEEIARGLEKAVKVPRGRYIVGKDIPAGTYTIELVEYDSYTVFNVWEKEYEVYDYNVGLLENINFSQEQKKYTKVVLSEGNVVETFVDYFIFTKYTGLGF